jgi:hypothetical protein
VPRSFRNLPQKIPLLAPWLLILADWMFNINRQVFGNIVILMGGLLLTYMRSLVDCSRARDGAGSDEIAARRRGRLLSIAGCVILTILVSSDLAFGIGRPCHDTYDNLKILTLVFILFAYPIGRIAAHGNKARQQSSQRE